MNTYSEIKGNIKENQIRYLPKNQKVIIIGDKYGKDSMILSDLKNEVITIDDFISDNNINTLTIFNENLKKYKNNKVKKHFSISEQNCDSIIINCDISREILFSIISKIKSYKFIYKTSRFSGVENILLKGFEISENEGIFKVFINKPYSGFNFNIFYSGMPEDDRIQEFIKDDLFNVKIFFVVPNDFYIVGDKNFIKYNGSFENLIRTHANTEGWFLFLDKNDFLRKDFFNVFYYNLVSHAESSAFIFSSINGSEIYNDGTFDKYIDFNQIVFWKKNFCVKLPAQKFLRDNYTDSEILYTHEPVILKNFFT